MKKKMDFILVYNAYYKDILRFYPRETRVHGFADKPPKSWDAVYKVYYSWSIFRQYDDNKKLLFDIHCDECSMIPSLSTIIKEVIKTGKTFNYPTLGQPAVDWIISKRNKKYQYYDYQVYNNWTNQGYRFTLNKKKTVEFCDWLDKINQYALKNGRGI